MGVSCAGKGRDSDGLDTRDLGLCGSHPLTASATLFSALQSNGTKLAVRSPAF